VYIAGQASRNHALIISIVFVYNSGNGGTTTTREEKDNIFHSFLLAELFYFSRVFFFFKNSETGTGKTKLRKFRLFSKVEQSKRRNRKSLAARAL
jgi:hypothetical protein